MKWNVTYTMHGLVVIEAETAEQAKELFENISDEVLVDGIMTINTSDVWKAKD